MTPTLQEYLMSAGKAFAKILESVAAHPSVPTVTGATVHHKATGWRFQALLVAIGPDDTFDPDLLLGDLMRHFPQGKGTSVRFDIPPNAGGKNVPPTP